nr:hypothetical protein [Candidatus Sigynarchaeota archaeon]
MYKNNRNHLVCIVVACSMFLFSTVLLDAILNPDIDDTSTLLLPRPNDYARTEDFESYTAGENINGKNGFLGAWTASASSGCSCTISSYGGDLVMDAKDGMGSGVVNAVLTFGTSGGINGLNVVRWSQEVYLNYAFNIRLMEWTSDNVQVYFNGRTDVCYYNGHSSSVVSTGLTYETGWETYEILLLSTSQFKIRQFKNYVWSSWRGPFDQRVHWSGAGAACNAWSLSGNTNGQPQIRFDDIGVSWVDGFTAIENFESYAAGDGIAGKTGPIGSWTAAIGSSCSCNVFNDNGNLVCRQIDGNTNSGVNSAIRFTTPGSPNGVDSIRWKQKISTYGNSWWAVSFYEGTTIRVTLFFNKYSNKVQYYVSGFYYDTGLTCMQESWETYEVLFFSTTQFKVRQYGGVWYGPFTNRDNSAWSSTGAVITKMIFGASTPDWYDVLFDDVEIFWSPSNNPPTLTTPSVTPGSGTTTISYTYIVTYTDIENTAPSYVRVHIDGSNYTMAKQNDSDITYTDGCLYTFSRTLSLGSHDYYFSTSDGFLSTSTSPYFGPTISTNTCPIITAPSVTPSSGNRDTVFTFIVTYTDMDDQAPLYVNLFLDNMSYAMLIQDISDNTYTDGVLYMLTMKLGPGSHYFYISCSDGSASEISSTQFITVIDYSASSTTVTIAFLVLISTVVPAIIGGSVRAYHKKKGIKQHINNSTNRPPSPSNVQPSYIALTGTPAKKIACWQPPSQRDLPSPLPRNVLRINREPTHPENLEVNDLEAELMAAIAEQS